MPRHPRPRAPRRGLRRTDLSALAQSGLIATALAGFSLPAAAAEFPGPDASIVRAMPRGPATAPGGALPTSTSNCAGAECDTVWIGHSSAGPGGAFLGVGVGGVWDFDTDVAGTDSTQGWKRWALHFRTGGFLPVTSRPAWALDYGNQMNEGNTNLWAARDLAGRKYVKTGAAGAWHADTMAGLKLNASDAAEPSATPIVGVRSAWCGLRPSGDTTAQDALTGNFLNGDLVIDQGPAGTNAEFPGYCNLWDQMLYKDFSSTGTGTVAFRFRTELSPYVEPISYESVAGSAWFNPDPTSIAHLVPHPADSFMVYVGSPNEGAYDTNRRWFSEVLDLTQPHQEILAVSGTRPLVAADTSVNLAYSGLVPIGGNVRLVFRIKTNRARSDQSTGVASGFNTRQGAAVIDEVQVDGGIVHGFESAAEITARSLIPNLAFAGGPWATTGKPPAVYAHVADVATLLYEDLCGAVGSPTRLCDLAGNVFVAGNADDGNRIPIESYQALESPTVDLYVRNQAPGTKNAQGIDQETASRTMGVVEFDIYSGFMNLDQSVFYRYAARAYSPATYFQPISLRPVWSNFLVYPAITFNPDPYCYLDNMRLEWIGIQPGLVDSVRIMPLVITQGFRFGGTDLGNTRGTYFDNIRLGLVRAPAKPALAQSMWNKFQDQFPFNEGVPPGDNAAFDTTTALMNSGLNIATDRDEGAVVAGDSILAQSPFAAGDGATTGARVDLVFRIDPGPGNYVVKGDRTSALVNRDPAHPFFAAYLADNGPFGTPGGHGGTWNRHVWNSARMDSAEIRTYPILSQGIGNPVADTWMGTLHEADPRYASLGIDRPLCFLVDPEGLANASNITCSGTAPAIYGAVAAASKEATKILPDGWFSPGTHIEYFVRSSTLENPGTYRLLFDTTQVHPQEGGGMPDHDQERWSSVDVLPDLWKSTRFGGAGLACVLLVDAADRRGANPAYRGALDSLGFGKDDGATSGWRALGAGSDPNDPAGFVAANRGQYGLRYDQYDVRASESAEAGRPGTRFAQNPGALTSKGDRSGPSAAMLAALYQTVIHATGDLSVGTLHDGYDWQEGADDIALYAGFLAGATAGNRRGLWLSGDGILEDATYHSDNGSILHSFLTETFGADLQAGSYKTYSSSSATTVGLHPAAAWAHPGRIYGFEHRCYVHADVLAVVPTVDGAVPAAHYQALGPGTGFTASVYRSTGEGREYRTLLDGFDASNLRGHYESLAAIGSQLETNSGRLAWIDDVVAGHLQICNRVRPAISVGDLPGTGGERFANRNLGAFPNPALAARGVTLRFTLAAPAEIRVRIFNVAGRVVATFGHRGTAGANAVAWDGRLGNGTSAPAGVYFYRLEGAGFESGSDGAGAKAKLILLSGN